MKTRFKEVLQLLKVGVGYPDPVAHERILR